MRLIDKLNNENPKQPKPIEKVKQAIKGELPTKGQKYDFYAKVQAQKKSLEVIFDYANAEGDLSCVDNNGVILTLTANEFKKSNGYYDKRIKDKFIGSYLRIKVKSIDEENNTVYLSSVVGKDNIKLGIIRELKDACNSGEGITVWGSVLSVTAKRITINIYNRHVLGILDVQDWSYGYTRSLVKFAKRGEVLTLLLKGQAERVKGKDPAFILTRKELYPDPWEKTSDFQIKGVMNVSLIEKPLDKSYAWGISALLPDIEIMMNYSSALEMRVGLTYKCKIVDIRKEDKVFKVVPFEIIEVGNTKKSLQYLRNREG